ncbi:hypothetical protein DFH28DRAFT_961787 [Melampsora americana]|nr:hypothetical protein DFH28DRAFT_961787 [Melampsora americana]
MTYAFITSRSLRPYVLLMFYLVVCLILFTTLLWVDMNFDHVVHENFNGYCSTCAIFSLSLVEMSCYIFCYSSSLILILMCF